MELYQLRSFVAIAEAGRLTRAADALHVSQPALSAQLRALEDELGLTLFRRGHEGMHLTEAGRHLLARAEKVLSAAQALKDEAATLKGKLAGTARIGTLSDPAFTRVGEFISASLGRYPLLKIELHQGITGELLAQVRDGDLDGAFFYGELHQPMVTGLALRRFTYRVVGPRDWEAELRDADWPRLAAKPWIITPPISSQHEWVTQLLKSHGVKPAKVVESDSETVIATLVVSGVGMALMREDLAHDREARGEVFIWSDVRHETTLWFVHARDRERDPTLRALLDVLKDLWALRREAPKQVSRRRAGEPAGGDKTAGEHGRFAPRRRSQ
ncbi:MAG: LysR family transcriptional regulator [Betaproteobacteria bacterium]|nr:LysR family transcriptional regulator [Betaproteobacteria bacterium]